MTHTNTEPDLAVFAQTLTYAADIIAMDRDYQLPTDCPLKPGMDRAEQLLRRLATKADADKTVSRRVLTPGEHHAAWHAIEGAAGQEGADPGTILNAVLNTLGIEGREY